MDIPTPNVDPMEISDDGLTPKSASNLGSKHRALSTNEDEPLPGEDSRIRFMSMSPADVDSRLSPRETPQRPTE